MYKKLIACLLLPLLWLPAAWGEEEFLKPDQAFVISTQSDDGNTVRFNWQIAEGYYLYQSKFRFFSDTAGVTLGDADMPPSGVDTRHFSSPVSVSSLTACPPESTYAEASDVE